MRWAEFPTFLLEKDGWPDLCLGILKADIGGGIESGISRYDVLIAPVVEQTLAAGGFGAVHRTGNSNALYKADQAFLSHGAQSCYVCRFDRAGCSGSSHCLWPRGTTPRDQWLSDLADRIRGFIGWNALTWRLNSNQISRLDSNRIQVAVPDGTVAVRTTRWTQSGHQRYHSLQVLAKKCAAMGRLFCPQGAIYVRQSYS
jgi:hypothetical protein